MADGLLERAAATVDQVIADVRFTLANGESRRGFASQLDGRKGHVHLFGAADWGQRLDGAALAIAAEKVHSRVGTRRVATQGFVHEADGLDHVGPVKLGTQAETHDGVGQGDLRDGLPAVLRANGLLGIHVFGSEVLLDDPTHGAAAFTIFA